MDYLVQVPGSYLRVLDYSRELGYPLRAIPGNTLRAELRKDFGTQREEN